MDCRWMQSWSKRMGKQENSGQKPKDRSRSPSSGRGAASALDALIKRRLPPAGPPLPAPKAPKKS
jgi:hypothetical protein